MVDTYDDHLLINGESYGGSQDPDGGYNPGTPGQAIYDGPCDAQEPSSSGLKIVSGETGVESLSADLHLFLKDESKATDIKPDMSGTLTRNGRDIRIVVENSREIDGLIEVNTQ